MKIYLLFSSRSFFAKNGEITNFEVFMPMDWKLNNELTIYLSDHFQHESHNTGTRQKNLGPILSFKKYSWDTQNVWLTENS